MTIIIGQMISKRFNPLNASVALIETSQLICTANQLTGFYIRATLPFNGFNLDKPQKG